MLGIPADDEEGVVLGVQPGTVLIEYAGRVGTFLRDGRKLTGKGVPNRFFLLPEERETERRRVAALVKETKLERRWPWPSSR